MEKIPSILENSNIISLALLIAIVLPIAFPPIVKLEIILVMIIVVNILLVPNNPAKVILIARPQLPLTTPHISPITSFKRDDTLSLFFINSIAFF